jgi:hypothetical protein
MTTEGIVDELDELIVKQKLLDAQDREVGEQIVKDANPKTIEAAKQLAANWIATAAQESRNLEYMTGERDKWKNRSEENEAYMELERIAHDETRGYRQHAESQLKDVRADLRQLLIDIDDAMRDVDPEVSWQNAGTREKLVKLAEGK